LRDPSCANVEVRFPTPTLVWQLDSIRVLPFPFVLLGKNLFQPVRLPLGNRLVHEGGIMKHGELLAATVTAKGAHFRESRCPFSGLTLLDCYCLHRLTFYLAAFRNERLRRWIMSR
jgi:hypothetical protein